MPGTIPAASNEVHLPNFRNSTIICKKIENTHIRYVTICNTRIGVQGSQKKNHQMPWECLVCLKGGYL